MHPERCAGMTRRRASFAETLVVVALAAAACAGAGEQAANPNLARLAKVTANSENVVRRKYFAQNAADGLIPVEGQGFADRGLRQTVWCVDGAKAGNKAGWLKFEWKEPVQVREIVYFGLTVWSLNDCWKDYEVYLNGAAKPIAKGTFEKKSGPQPIRLDKPYETRELTLKFTSSYGGRNPGASEVMVFPRRATKRDILLAMGGWRLAYDAYLFLHLRSLGLSKPTPKDIAALISKMKAEFGEGFDAARFREKLAALTNGDPADDENPPWGYRLSALEKLQLEILLFDQRLDFPRVPAFPGAEGFGAYTVGGRGGRVIEVTNLKDSGPGSFRAAVKAKGPRTVVFRVSGTIRLENHLAITNPYITIAGQSAPGDGICIQGHELSVYADQVIIRFLRVRPGDVLGKPIGDAISGRFVQNVILDHCSMSWTMDEVCTWYALGNVTVQWCIMSEALDRSLHPKGAHGAGHATGGLNLSSHHNLIASCNFRNPRFGGCGNLRESLVDFRNNVIYNFVTSAYGGEGGTYNFINNYYKRGPSSRSRHFLTPYRHPLIGYGTWYIAGNVMEGNPAITRDNWRGVDRKVPRADKPFPCAHVTTQTAREAYGLVLEKAGAIYPKRDPVDTRIVNDVRKGTGRIINSQKQVGGYPTLKTYNVPPDTDHDGMPDDWERKHGLDPSDPADGPRDKDRDGYTNLEEYLNRTDPTKFVNYADPKNNVHTYH